MAKTRPQNYEQELVELPDHLKSKVVEEAVSRDKIQRNIESVSLHSRNELRNVITQNRMRLNDKLTSAAATKDAISKERRFKHQFNLIKWDIIKKKKEVMIKDANKRHSLMLAC